MRVTRREAIGTAVAIAAFGSASSADDGVHLAEAAKPGEAFLNELQLSLVAKLTVERDGKPEQLPFEANAKHRYVEMVQPNLNGGRVKRAARHYREAQSASSVAGDRSKKQLADDRRGVVVQRSESGPIHFSPSGPLSREELELVSEHFETLSIPDLLPGKVTKLGESWSVAADAVRAVCHFDELVKSELVGKFVELKDGIALLKIEGRADGIEHGSPVRVAVSAKLTYDVAGRYVTRVEWSQADGRDRGPISPAMEVKATVIATRSREANVSKELEAVVAKQPADGKVPDLLLQLRHIDPNGFEFLHPRDWHTVVKSDKHIVLRLLVKGEYVAQATFAAWKPDAADEKSILAEFVEATRKQSGWEPEKAIENGMMQVGAARPIYRLAAVGKQDGTDVVQSFHLVTAADGRRVAVAVVCGTNVVEKLGTSDVALVSGIEFPAKK